MIWDPQGRPTALPLLPGDDLGVAYDLDLRGNVVGYSRGSDGRRSHSTAVRWVPTRDYR